MTREIEEARQALERGRTQSKQTTVSRSVQEIATIVYLAVWVAAAVLLIRFFGIVVGTVLAVGLYALGRMLLKKVQSR